MTQPKKSPSLPLFIEQDKEDGPLTDEEDGPIIDKQTRSLVKAPTPREKSCFGAKDGEILVQGKHRESEEVRDGSLVIDASHNPRLARELIKLNGEILEAKPVDVLQFCANFFNRRLESERVTHQPQAAIILSTKLPPSITKTNPSKTEEYEYEDVPDDPVLGKRTHLKHMKRKRSNVVESKCSVPYHDEKEKAALVRRSLILKPQSMVRRPKSQHSSFVNPFHKPRK